jgi:hypothetical protein
MLPPFLSQLRTALPPALAAHPQLGLAQSQYRVANPSPPEVSGGNLLSVGGCDGWVGAGSVGLLGPGPDGSVGGGPEGWQRPQVAAQ